MLENKVAIVTGGSKGMGRHFVDALVAAGARVASFARSSAENTALEKEYGANVAAIACDVSDPDQVNAAVAETIARFGRIDALINNAAIFDLFRLENATDAQIRASVEINLLGPLWCIRAATPHLCETRGHILSISSESVRMPFPYLSVYAATKAAVETLGTAMRDELRDKGVRVTTLRSGSVSGGSGGAIWDPAVAEEFFETIQRTGHAAFTGHAASPESMARAVVSALSMPGDINVDFLEVRASEPMREDSVDQIRQRGARVRAGDQAD